MESNKKVIDVRNYFSTNYGYVHLDQMSDGFILKFLNEPWLQRLSFEQQMNCLYDHVLAQDLCDVEE